MVRRMLCVPGGYRHAYRQANQITCGRCTHLSCGLPFPSPPVLKHRLRIDRHPPGVGSLIDISNQLLGPVATRRCLSYRGGPSVAPRGYPGQTAPRDSEPGVSTVGRYRSRPPYLGSVTTRRCWRRADVEVASLTSRWRR